MLHALKLYPSSQQYPVLYTEPPQTQAPLNGELTGQLSAGPLGGSGVLLGFVFSRPVHPTSSRLRISAWFLRGTGINIASSRYLEGPPTANLRSLASCSRRK